MDIEPETSPDQSGYRTDRNELVTSPNPYGTDIRLSLSPDTPSVILDMLAQQEFQLRWNVAINPSCSAETLERLISDDGSVRDQVAQNPSCSAHLLRRIVTLDYTAPYPGSRIQALRHPNCPADLLWQYVADTTESWYQEAIVANPACPADLLVELVTTPFSTVWDKAIHHPNLPAHMRAIIKLGAPYPTG